MYTLHWEKVGNAMGFLSKLGKVLVYGPEKKGDPKTKPADTSNIQYGDIRPGDQPAKSGTSKNKERPALNHGELWTRDEEKRLSKAYDRGTTIGELSQIHGRTYQAISHRLIKLGYKGITTTEPHSE
jgi:hypothetical protein